MSGLLTAILIAVALVLGIGLVCAVLLTVSSKVMAVKTDERVEKIRNCLPGANCGACGYTGCDGYAEALVKGDSVKTNLCIPGATDVAKSISEILGVGFSETEKKVAFVKCNGNCEATSKKHDYIGLESCAAVSLLYGGDGKCTFGCIGLGDCASVCTNDSICIENGIAHIDPRSCMGCGLCANKCPKHLISIREISMPTIISCSNKQKGAVARKSCKNACIGCKKCEMTCPSGAITVTDNLASIDYSKCSKCGKCAELCPVGCIHLTNINEKA